MKMLMKIFHNRRGVDMQDWFGIVFSVAIGAFVFFGMAGLLIVTEQREQNALEELQSAVDDSFFLMTYLRTPLSQHSFGVENDDDHELRQVRRYLAKKDITAGQLIDMVGNAGETQALFRENGNLDVPEEIRQLTDDEIESLLEELLETHYKEAITATYGIQGWSLTIDYPEEYSREDIIHDIGGFSGGRASEAIIPTLDGRNVITVRLIRDMHPVFVRP